MDDESTTGAPAGLFRRLAALLYDILLVIAIAAVATFAMLPLTRGEAILASTQGLLGHAYRAVVVLAAFAYFGRSWTRSGQTLGMSAWHIRLRSEDGTRLGWAGAVVRFTLGAAIAWVTAVGAWYLARATSPLGRAVAGAMLLPAALNFGWIILDPAGRTLLDLAGRSRMLRN